MKGSFALHQAAKEGKPITALVDGSDYLKSICDHAAWCAERAGAAIHVAHIHEPPASQPANDNLVEASERKLLARAVGRLSDDGATQADAAIYFGSLPQQATSLSRDADLLVIGRRSMDAAGVGENVEQIVTASEAAVLVSPKLFLPIASALGLHSDAQGARFASALRASPWLQDLSLQVRAADSPMDEVPACDLVVLPRHALSACSDETLRSAAHQHLGSRRPVPFV